MKVELTRDLANRFWAVRAHCRVYGEVSYILPDAGVDVYVEKGLLRLKKTQGSKEFYELTELGNTADVAGV